MGVRLATKLILALMLITVGMVGVRSYLNAKDTVLLYDEGLRHDQQLLAGVLNEAVIDIWQPQGWEAALAFLESAERQRGQVDIRWVWLDESQWKDYKPRVPKAELSALEGKQTLQVELKTTNSLYTYRRVELKGLPPGAIELTRKLDDRARHARAILGTELYTSAVLLAVYAAAAALLGMLLIGRPVERLIEQVRQIGGGDFTAMKNLPVKDELGELARELLKMAAKLRGAKRQVEAEREARLEVEGQLRHADRLSSVGRLTAGVIHDLGTPLNVISGRASGIKSGRVTGDIAQNHAGIIAEQSKKITAMIRRLLGFARRHRAQTERTELVSMSREVLALLEPLAKKSKVDCKFTPKCAQLIAPVSTDLIEQLLNNLVMNAIQAMANTEDGKDGGTVTVSVDKKADEFEQTTALLVVEDDGPGISEEARERIFEAFYTTKAEHQGTGLGLSVCQQIAKGFGGTIQVDSTPGEGARFTVAIPLRLQTGDETTEVFTNG